MTDTSTAPEGQQADTAGSLDGTQWKSKYDGLQRVLGQRTNDLAEARRIAEEATRRAEAAEAAARDYQGLYEALYAPEPVASAPPLTTDDVDEPEPHLDPNNPRRQASAFETPEPRTSADWFERLGQYPADAFGNPNVNKG